MLLLAPTAFAEAGPILDETVTLPPRSPQPPETLPDISETQLPASEKTEAAESATTIESPNDEKPRMAARFDAQFQSGNGLTQGFYLPSFRVSAFGAPTKSVRYRLSVGQTREFSSVLLPQLVPVEAFAVLGLDGTQKSKTTVTVGLFSPSLQPWWTPDLTDLPLPDYAQNHRALLLGRELGVEFSYTPIPGRLEGAIGAFNGTGNTGANTGGGAAFTAFLRAGLGTANLRFTFGAGGYFSTLGALDAIDYREVWMSDIFAHLDFNRGALRLGVDGLFGRYADTFRSTNPYGGGAFLLARMVPYIKLFTRFEMMDAYWGAPTRLRQAQFGPVIRWDETFSTYVLAQASWAQTSALSLGFVARSRFSL